MKSKKNYEKVWQNLNQSNDIGFGCFPSSLLTMRARKAKTQTQLNVKNYILGFSRKPHFLRTDDCFKTQSNEISDVVHNVGRGRTVQRCARMQLYTMPGWARGPHMTDWLHTQPGHTDFRVTIEKYWSMFCCCLILSYRLPVTTFGQNINRWATSCTMTPAVLISEYWQSSAGGGHLLCCVFSSVRRIEAIWHTDWMTDWH